MKYYCVQHSYEGKEICPGCVIDLSPVSPEELAKSLWRLDAPKANPDTWDKFTPRLKKMYLDDAAALLDKIEMRWKR